MALSAREGVDLTVAGMCAACADVLLMAGAGIILMATDGPGATYQSKTWVEPLEALQFTLGVGPGTDAYVGGLPVIEVDLIADPPWRWSTFVGSAIEAGMRAVFSFPLQVGAARIGTLTLYQDHAGRLDDDRYADAVVMAAIVTRAVLAIQAGAADGALAAELGDGDLYQSEVHQASGMVSVQLDILVGEALARIRARAFAEGRTVGEVAREVVTKRLCFER